ncbi:hypothetical protein CROQUDRAFT_663784 [Cronartium quercuum f. sp. fusiforme G11]|uniref:Carnitine O-acetyltransferase, mitochondrial n=1 Tax=Cronartium quercuum f. sp. fusiforme G11 TaxID=708437 RepID=A0A9P6NCE1_9BASI|nr:hypothetical protein CROQUDRAFT_663784 [Cronartium quercuum f. sp. fusiforme G11]
MLSSTIKTKTIINNLNKFSLSTHYRPFNMSTIQRHKKTFEAQHSLPQLPVPDLHQTANKYFHSILPIVSPQAPGTALASDENPTPAYIQTKLAVEEFKKSPLVNELQNRLLSRAKEEGRESWLIEWWNDLAYMGYRDPLIPFSSYYIAHQFNPKHLNPHIRAATLIRGMMYFRQLIITEQLEPEKTRNGHLCMNSYKWLFNTCRYPNKPSDTAKAFDPLKNQHLTVIRKGKFFEFDVVKSDGSWLSTKELETQFKKVVEIAGDQETDHPIGALTSEHRDTWTDARGELIKHSEANAKALERIESSILCVALDDSRPLTREELAWGLWSGDGKNRFFDKQQLIVFENGQSGFNAEHSCMDGTPVATMNDWVLSRISNSTLDLGNTNTTPSKAIKDPKPILFELSNHSKQSINKAIENHQKLMNSQTLNVLQYVGFGKSIIKNVFKSSPDAVAQLIMQLAHYKFKGFVPVTYESAQTRKFKLGRTEVIRSCSPESLEWCKSMENLDSNLNEKIQKFRIAEKAHVKYATWASNGEGVDRHLLGLRLLLKEGEEKPKLFTDPTYTASTTWTFSTSTLPSEHFNGLGYGPVVDDGFGIAYAVNENSLRYTITTTTGQGDRLKHFLQEAAEDIKTMMLNAGGQVHAKL